MDYMVDFIEAKYHFTIADRMLKNYAEYPEKRFLVGVINEGAKAASRLIRAFMIYDNVKRGNLKKFIHDVAPKYLEARDVDNLVKILEVERAQKVSRVEFAKGDKIILLIGGKYRILTISRLTEFLVSISNILDTFATSIKR